MSKKTIIIGIITVILLALIGGGVFWYLNKHQGEDNGQEVNPAVAGNENQPGDNTQAENNNQQSEIDTSNWQTYRNEEYGFEVRYPEGCIIRELQAAHMRYPKGKVIVCSMLNNTKTNNESISTDIHIEDQGIITIGNDLSDSIALEFTPINNFAELQRSNDFFQGNFEIINGIEFLKIIDEKTHGGESIYYIAQNKYNNKFIAFSTYLGGIDNTIDNQKEQFIYNIVSAIKFIE
jgi:uncharacterized protein YxeA